MAARSRLRVSSNRLHEHETKLSRRLAITRAEREKLEKSRAIADAERKKRAMRKLIDRREPRDRRTRSIYHFMLAIVRGVERVDGGSAQADSVHVGLARGARCDVTASTACRCTTTNESEMKRKGGWLCCWLARPNFRVMYVKIFHGALAALSGAAPKTLSDAPHRSSSGARGGGNTSE